MEDEAAVKAAGKIMTKGKDYVVEDGKSSSSLLTSTSNNAD